MSQRTMTREEHERLYALVQNPPLGSKMEAARVYGVDLDAEFTQLDAHPGRAGSRNGSRIEIRGGVASSGGSP